MEGFRRDKMKKGELYKSAEWARISKCNGIWN
jgi:hypothetical protein